MIDVDLDFQRDDVVNRSDSFCLHLNFFLHSWTNFKSHVAFSDDGEATMSTSMIKSVDMLKT